MRLKDICIQKKKKEDYIVGKLNDMSNLYYDKKDSMIKFEQTPDIYYSLFLDNIFTKEDAIVLPKVSDIANTYCIDKSLHKTTGLDCSGLNTKETASNIINTYKGYYNSKYDIIVEPLSHTLHLNDFYKLEKVFRDKCSLIPIVLDISYNGIELCNLLKFMTLQKERIFGIILLSNRRTFIYIYSKFSINLNINQFTNIY